MQKLRAGRNITLLSVRVGQNLAQTSTVSYSTLTAIFRQDKNYSSISLEFKESIYSWFVDKGPKFHVIAKKNESACCKLTLKFTQ